MAVCSGLGRAAPGLLRVRLDAMPMGGWAVERIAAQHWVSPVAGLLCIALLTLLPSCTLDTFFYPVSLLPCSYSQGLVRNSLGVAADAEVEWEAAEKDDDKSEEQDESIEEKADEDSAHDEL